MAINTLTALNAYQNQMKMMQNAATGGDDAESSGGTGSMFAQMVKDAAQGAINVEKQSEAHQLQSLTASGNMGNNLSDVVTSITNAELTLNAVVAVRDRVINAYNDIIKMNI
jgi:flagellar hook-basal body complex protein FliE